MKHIKTFESYNSSEVVEEGFLDRAISGGKVFTLTPDKIAKTKSNWCMVDGKAPIKAADCKSIGGAVFTIEGDVVKGGKVAMKIYSDLKSKYGMTNDQALTIVCMVYEWDGFGVFDPIKSKWNEKKAEFEWIPAKSIHNN